VTEREPETESPTAVIVPRTITIENETIFRIQDELNFNIDGTHGLIHVFNIDRDSVDLIIGDSYLELAEDEPQNIVLGEQELIVTLKSMTSDSADIVMKRIVKKTTPTVANTVVEQPVQEKESSWPLYLLGSLVATGTLTAIWGGLRKKYK